MKKKRLNRRERAKGRNSAKHGHTKDAFEILDPRKRNKRPLVITCIFSFFLILLDQWGQYYVVREKVHGYTAWHHQVLPPLRPLINPYVPINGFKADE